VKTIVVKVGSSTVADDHLRLRRRLLAGLVADIAELVHEGRRVVLVSSGAIACGQHVLGVSERPHEVPALQAASAVGQGRLFAHYERLFGDHELTAAQVLLTSEDFARRSSYVNARNTLRRLLSWGVVPVVNENDTVADDEIRFGDNDRIAALVANVIRADVLVLLTDTAGLFTADPRLDADASLIEEITAVDEALDAQVGGAGSARGSGGMATKLAAARIASWSGVRAVIAAADAPDVVAGAIEGRSVGTVVMPHRDRLSSRKLWIAFAVGAAGRIVVDDGARVALEHQGRSLLAAGVRSVQGDFDAQDAVVVVGPDGRVFAKGLVRSDSSTVRAVAGRRTSEIAADLPTEVIHRDDLVVLS
jgi:glutamate 5-kinase